MSLRYSSDTNVGLRRSVNQDAIVADATLGLFVVADGMGGHERGEVAADIVVTSIAGYFRSSAQAAGSAAAEPLTDPGQVATRLQEAVLLANRRVSEQGGGSAAAAMGATTVAALFTNDTVVLAHVGDCRAYVLDEESGWRAVTQDHSWIADQVAAGFITASAARHHPWRNVVSRAVQGQDSLEVDTVELALSARGRLLLCSDGLHGVVEDDEIRRLVSDPVGRFETLAPRLIGAALDRGAPDNVSAIVVEWA